MTEAGRESLRDLGKWERALLDTSGGHLLSYPPAIGLRTGESIVAAPIITEFEDGSPALASDFGATAGTAQPLTLAKWALCLWRLDRRGEAQRQLNRATQLAPQDATIRAIRRQMGLEISPP